jgi:hypothetical protein
MQSINMTINNFIYQLKNIEMQFENMRMQIQNMGMINNSNN